MGFVLWEQVESCELDEMWSFVQNKSNQRWLWLAIDHDTREVLAYTFGKRKDKVFRELKALLEPFGISTFYTDDWGSYVAFPILRTVKRNKNTKETTSYATVFENAN